MDLALETLNKIEDIQWFLDREYDFYTHRAFQNYYNGNDEEAIKDFEKSTQYNFNDFYKSAKYRIWATCLSNRSRYSQAKDKFAEAWVYKAQELGVDSDFLSRDCFYNLNKKEKSVKDPASEKLLWQFLECRNDCKEITMEDLLNLGVELAYKGNKEAKQWCIDMKIDYKREHNLNNLFNSFGY